MWKIYGGQRVGKKLNAEYFEVDRVLDEHNLIEDKEKGYISQRSSIKANKIVAPKAKNFLDKGKRAVFDGNFYWRSQVDDLIKRLDFPHYVLTLKALLEIFIARDRDREKTHGEDAVRAVYKKSTEFDYGIVDVIESFDKSIEEILSCLL